jgi:tRNA (pseudouridine54-N1)-methyltransferase
MREFVYYSKNAVTAGNFIKDNLMKAGRIDIVCNVIIQTLFISNEMRKDVRLHLIFDGPPTPRVHLIFDSSKEIPISKKDIAGLIKRMLYKCPKDSGKIIEVFSGCFIERKSFESLIKELDKEGKNVFVLHGKGEDIRNLKIKGNEVFILGDQGGFSGKEKFLKNIEKISVGPRVLFASQVAVLINNEIDRG